jgi:hypothetical protein
MFSRLVALYHYRQRKSIGEGGGFETRPPERPPIQITDVQLLTNVWQFPSAETNVHKNY